MSRISTLKAFTAGLILGAGCLLVGCSAEAETAAVRPSGSSEPIGVVCTTGMVGDLVRHVGGSRVSVEDLMGPGVDPHLYRATLSDTQRLNRAQVVFYNGLHLEGRLAEMLEGLARRKPVFAVSERLVRDHDKRLRKPAAFEGNYDPHIWFDVDMWSKCLEPVVARLSELDPAHADQFRHNAEQYAAEMAKLDRWCHTRLAEIPKERRVLVTAHDAFGYFGAAYDIEVHGIQGVSTADEADLGHIIELVDMLVTRKIKAVFVESSVPPRLIDSLIQPAAARGHKVVKGGELFSDAMGQPGTHEGTYVGMVEHNVNTIVKALQ